MKFCQIYNKSLIIYCSHLQAQEAGATSGEAEGDEAQAARN